MHPKLCPSDNYYTRWDTRNHEHQSKQTTARRSELLQTTSSHNAPSQWTCFSIGCDAETPKANSSTTGGQAQRTWPTTGPSIIQPATTSKTAINPNTENNNQCTTSIYKQNASHQRERPSSNSCVIHMQMKTKGLPLIKQQKR